MQYIAVYIRNIFVILKHLDHEYYDRLAQKKMELILVLIKCLMAFREYKNS